MLNPVAALNDGRGHETEDEHRVGGGVGGLQHRIHEDGAVVDDKDFEKDIAGDDDEVEETQGEDIRIHTAKTFSGDQLAKSQQAEGQGGNDCCYAQPIREVIPEEVDA